jgi:hypothetical protein
MYAKCGSIEGAQRLFNKMPSHECSLRMPYLEDMSCMVMVRKFFRFWTDVCEVGAAPDDHFCFPSFSLWPCRFVDERPTLCYAAMITVYMISALQSDDWSEPFIIF